MDPRNPVASSETGSSIAGGSIPVPGGQSGSRACLGRLNLPRVVHRIWIEGSPAIQGRARHFSTRWKAMNLGWEVREWTGPEFTMINQSLYDHPPVHDSFRFKADLLRLEILHRFGGVYVDMDVEPLRPIEDLLTGGVAYAAYSPNLWHDKRIISNAFIASEKKHPWIHRCITHMEESIETYGGQFLAMVTGPHHVNRCLLPSDDVTILPTSVIYPVYSSEVMKAYMFHSWDNKKKLNRESLP